MLRYVDNDEIVKKMCSIRVAVKSGYGYVKEEVANGY